VRTTRAPSLGMSFKGQTLVQLINTPVLNVAYETTNKYISKKLNTIENSAIHCHFCNLARSISGVRRIAMGLNSPYSKASNISSDVSKRLFGSLAMAFKITFSSQLGISGRYLVWRQ
jgi:hypothetical protein